MTLENFNQFLNTNNQLMAQAEIINNSCVNGDGCSFGKGAFMGQFMINCLNIMRDEYQNLEQQLQTSKEENRKNVSELCSIYGAFGKTRENTDELAVVKITLLQSEYTQLTQQNKQMREVLEKFAQLREKPIFFNYKHPTDTNYVKNNLIWDISREAQKALKGGE